MKKLIFALLFGIFLGFLTMYTLSIMATKKKTKTIIWEKTNQVNEAVEYIEYLEKQRDTLEQIIEIAYNSAVQFERLVGVKDPDGIVVYKEKCYITAKKMNRIKNVKL